jgi:hypothetical protein
VSRRTRLAALALSCAALFAGAATAQDVMIRHAKVHTAGARGTLAAPPPGGAPRG